MSYKTEIIKNFLNAQALPDLAALYSYDMEVQVNVAQDGGSRIKEEYKGRTWHGWTDGIQTWKSFRIPFNAMGEPTYTDTQLNWDFEKHVEGIGLTGWDWVNKKSRWVAYDFDALMGHATTHSKKCTDAELLEIKKAIESVEWVTLRYSTSGKGLHLYVFIADEQEIKNHTEHAAVARSILSKLSGLVGFDFNAKVDTCGGNMWVWHRKQRGTNGLQLIKDGGFLEEIPINWYDHVNVVKGTRKRNKPLFIDNEDAFEDLTSRRLKIKLEPDHKKLIEWIETNYPNSSWWDSDHHMLVTHTYILKEAHSDLEMKGVFKTKALGREKGVDHNCFCFPIRKGGWTVRRYTLGIEEENSWEQDGIGYTKCLLNADPDLKTVANAFGAAEDIDGGFVFANAADAAKAAEQIGASVSIPTWATTKPCKLKPHKDGRLIVEMNIDPGEIYEPKDMKGWVNKGKTWKKIFNARTNSNTESEISDYDDVIRHIVTESGEDCGWVLKAESQWTEEPLTHVKAALKSLGEKSANIDPILGSAVFRRWTLVKRPFEPEFLGDRTWNRNAPQLAYASSTDVDRLQYPTWMKILEHVGKDLDVPIKSNAWAQTNGILTGADYLKCWIASVFQFPFKRLPYLFFYGPQDSGKSILPEGLALLLTKGFMRADMALTNQSGFNSELETIILCSVEEIDLSQHKGAYNRIKDWVTAEVLPIHAKYREPYMAPNMTHWIQTANHHHHCPIFPGDTRITMAYVGNLDPLEMIPKPEMFEMLKKEAPAFLAEIMNLEIPPSNSRLNVPIIETAAKTSVQRINKSQLEVFMEEFTHAIPGEMINYSEFVDRFWDWIDPNIRHEWSKRTIGRELPPEFPHARSRKDGHYYIGNLSWEPQNGHPDKQPLVVKTLGKLDFLVPLNEES